MDPVVEVDDEIEVLTPEEQQEAEDREKYMEALRFFIRDHPEMRSAFGGHDAAKEFAEKHQTAPWLQRMAMDAVTGRVRGDLYEVFSDRKPKYIDEDLEEIRQVVKALNKVKK